MHRAVQPSCEKRKAKIPKSLLAKKHEAKLHKNPKIQNKHRLITRRQRQACRKSRTSANACEKVLRRQLGDAFDRMGPAPPETMRAFDSRKRSPPSEERCSEARPRSAKKPAHYAHAKNERTRLGPAFASSLSCHRRRHSFLSPPYPGAGSVPSTLGSGKAQGRARVGQPRGSNR